MSDSGYAYDQGWEDERARLAGIEAMWDTGTQAILSRWAGPGARILEAGAGGGSVVAWLSDQVGPAGHVLALDLDTRFVEPLRSEVVDVREANLVTDDLPIAEYDVVHSRLVLEHIPERVEVLARLAACLRPGGTLVVEDYDWTSFGFESADPTQLRAAGAILDFMSAAGFDRSYGRGLVGSFASLGLSDIEGEGRLLVIDSSHPGFPFFSLSFEQLAPAAVSAGFMSDEDVRVVGEQLQGGEGRIITPTLVAAIGRKP